MAHHNVNAPIEGEDRLANRAAPGISYFTPLQDPPAGTLMDPKSQPEPKLFQPIKIRGLTLPNRIVVSPMCQYSAEDGHMTNWHLTHLGGIAQRGPGLTCIEATAVTANGRITPEDVGLWKDSQINKMKEVVEFLHSQNQKVMIQLAHAGRKASTVAPWLSGGETATEANHGWPDNVWAPSAIPWNEKFPMPKEMTGEDIEEFKKAFGKATERALKVDVDAIEIHGAHGYLLTSFLSPVSNRRTDKYGGSFENRIRLLLETVDLVRGIIPKDMPLFVRVSATEWLEEQKDKYPESWQSEDTVKLAEILATKEVDLLDVSSGGNNSDQHPHSKPGYQVPFALAAKKAVGDKMLVSAVGSITEGKQAEGYLNDGLDMVQVARAFQKNPGLVFAWADDLGVEVNMPNQIRWGFGGRGKKASKA